MRRSIPFVVSCLFITACAAAEVPQTFDKHYPMQGRAELEAGIGNGSIKTTGCGTCRDIHVHLEMNNADRSTFHIEEQQSGNHVRFVLKQDEGHWHWNGGKGPELTIEVPQQSALDLHSGNGSVVLSGVQGDIAMNTGNGSVSISDAGGQIKLHSGNGSVSGENLTGSLNASTGNGSMHVAGRFSRLDAHTGNGSLNLEAGGPDALREGATITSGSGGVTLRLDRACTCKRRAFDGQRWHPQRPANHHAGRHGRRPAPVKRDAERRRDVTADQYRQRRHPAGGLVKAHSRLCDKWLSVRPQPRQQMPSPGNFCRARLSVS